MHWYEQEVRAKERLLARLPDVQARVPFYGSSSIRLWEGLPRDFPRALNVGFGGSTLEACAWFFNRLIVPLRPRRLLLYAGDNDLGDGAGVRGYQKRFDDFLRTLDYFFPALPLTVLTIKPSPARRHLLPTIRSCNEMMAARLGRRGRAELLDIFTPMLDDYGEPRPDLYGEDGLHMLRSGYRIWRDVVAANAAWVFGEG